jgi:hypothetical protein
MKFRPKNVIIDAFLWDGEQNQDSYPKWFSDAVKNGKVRISARFKPSPVGWFNLDGTTSHAPIGAWIILDQNGVMRSCKPSVFKATYEPVTE